MGKYMQLPGTHTDECMCRHAVPINVNGKVINAINDEIMRIDKIDAQNF
jgi:hypothetical protein